MNKARRETALVSLSTHLFPPGVSTLAAAAKASFASPLRARPRFVRAASLSLGAGVTTKDNI